MQPSNKTTTNKCASCLLFVWISLFAICSFFTLPVWAFTQHSSLCEQSDTFNLGVGLHDITGPAAEEGMMGYGMLSQQTAGILQRLWARAFIIESPCNGKRIVFVNVDLGHVFQAVKQQVVSKLKEKYGEMYSDENILVTAIHTHSGPGGYSNYILYNLTSLGFSRENFTAIVDGIVAAISDAHTRMTVGTITLAEGRLTGMTYNRSPSAYLLNPSIERARYDSDVDTGMTLIRFNDQVGKPIGLINWFPVHGVSMNNKNHFIHGDNKGYAAYLFEKEMNAQRTELPFVAAFAQSNAGDVSPNPLGQEGKTGIEGMLAVEKAGKLQYETAKNLFQQMGERLKGGVDYRHTFIAMDGLSIAKQYTGGRIATTCPAAIGVSMLAGTQDGEGIGWQGIACKDLARLPFFRLVCQLVTTPCQGVKPIAIPTGSMQPHPWTPRILPFQIIQIGQLIIVSAPFELTTMTGRRVKEAVAHQLPVNNDHIVLSTLANAYAGYVATHEEYQLQRYEGASTHFGPWTESALQQIFANLTRALVMNESVQRGPLPPDLLNDQVSLQTGVWFDDKPVGKEFGDIFQDVKAEYHPGETVTAVFWGGHPKNDYRVQGTFLRVEKLDQNGYWQTIRQDNDWDTIYQWERSGVAYSLITVTWQIPGKIKPGQYRILHEGNWKSFLLNKVFPYQGASSIFAIT